jgi:hypothetical protein
MTLRFHAKKHFQTVFPPVETNKTYQTVALVRLVARRLANRAGVEAPKTFARIQQINEAAIHKRAAWENVVVEQFADLDTPEIETSLRVLLISFCFCGKLVRRIPGGSASWRSAPLSVCAASRAMCA